MHVTNGEEGNNNWVVHAGKGFRKVNKYNNWSTLRLSEGLVPQCNVSTTAWVVDLGQCSICRVGVAGFNPHPHWMRTTSPVAAENFGLGVGFDPSRPVPAKPLTTWRLICSPPPLPLTNKPYRPRLRFESCLTYGALQVLFTSYLLT